MHYSTVRSPIPALRRLTALVLGASVLALPAITHAADGVRYVSKYGGKVTISGTSTIHDWTMVGTLIQGFLALPAGVTLDPAQAALAGVTGGKVDAHAEVTIPVRSVKNAEYSGMDEVMQQAMNATDHPKIQFFLGEMVFKEPHAAGTPLMFDTKGELVVNNITNKINLTVSMQSDDKDKAKLRVIGATALKMSDYKVKAPVLGIGNVGITTADDVKVTFDWLIGLPTEKK